MKEMLYQQKWKKGYIAPPRLAAATLVKIQGRRNNEG
jgi:hypothetical protein